MRIFLAVFACLLSGAAHADPPVIEDVSISAGAIHVTVLHPDTGWDHYADVWRVFAADGTQIAERMLLHPHVQEQPFTRSTSFPEIAGTLTVIASCTQGDLSEPFEYVPSN